MSAALTEARQVRVTLEGTACTVAGGRVLRVRLAGDGPLVMIDPEWPGVEVEAVEPPRVWTDGDVLQDVEDDRVWRRITRNDGLHRWSPGLWATGTDAEMERKLAEGSLRVLRYQAGEA